MLGANDVGRLAAQSAVRTLDCGDVRLTYVVDGAMAFYPERFLPSVPSAHWSEAPGRLDPVGRVPMSAGGLLVERSGRALLIDAGLGPMVHESVMGAVNSGSLMESLALVGASPAEIDTVAFTHVHADHTGWAFSRDAESNHGPAFPKARYVLSRQEWAPFGRGETVPGAPPHASLFSTLSKELVLVENGDEIFPGVHCLVTPGHSIGHTTYIIRAREERIVVFGDVFHSPVQFAHPEYGSAPDVAPANVPGARRTVLAELETAGTLGFAFHFGDQPFGRVVRNADNTPIWQAVPGVVLGPPPRHLNSGPAQRR